MNKLILDHSYYYDSGFESWNLFFECLPKELFPYDEAVHPGANCRFLALENFNLEFADVNDGKSFQQGFSYRVDGSIFDLERSIPNTIKEEYGIQAMHKNINWKDFLKPDGTPEYFLENDSRIGNGWGYLSPTQKLVHPELNIWVTQFVGSAKIKPDSKKKWNLGRFRLLEVHFHDEVINDNFFKFLNSNDSDVDIILDIETDRPISKVVVETCAEYFDLLRLPNKNGVKSLKAKNIHQYDILFKLVK